MPGSGSPAEAGGHPPEGWRVAARWTFLPQRRRRGLYDASGTIDTRYCIYNPLYDNYVYTPAFIDRIVEEIGTREKFQKFFGRDPEMKVTTLADRVTAAEPPTDPPAVQTA